MRKKKKDDPSSGCAQGPATNLIGWREAGGKDLHGCFLLASSKNNTLAPSLIFLPGFSLQNPSIHL